MSKIKIKKNDSERILLTELLPYEMPMLVSNEGLYCAIKSNKYSQVISRVQELGCSNYTIPFDYLIRKGSCDTRKLSVIHPLSQKEFIDFYKKYHSLILNLCSRSPFSLRHPATIAKYCYSPSFAFEEDGQKDDDVETEPEILDRETKLIKSYFSYKKYDLIYKFFESYEFQRLEQRFSCLTQFDIHRCFYNIYTHSITWAVKDKESAKKNHRETSFENEFDKIMQKSNYNETNGIVVGPEISRIFAEIILQRIDLEVLEDLSNLKLKYGDGFEIKRYVDDYFVFANNFEITQQILSFFKKHLEVYKLYLNDKKVLDKKRPFISKVTVVKFKISCLFYSLKKSFLEDLDKSENNSQDSSKKHLKHIRSPYSLSKHFIREFQCAASENDVDYPVVCKEVTRHLKKLTVDVLGHKTLIQSEDSAIENFLLFVLDVVFFTYTLDMTASTTFKLSQLI